MTETTPVAAANSGGAPSQTAAASRDIPLDFRAQGGEYFRIWIVNLLLTILTLGIYSAWAKVRRLRYFYGSTFLDGTSFEYHGQPIAILKGRLIAFGVYIIMFALSTFLPIFFLLLLPLIIFGLPWIIMRSRLFQMRMSSYRNIRFNFHGNYADALGAFIGWAILAAITLYILVPIWLWKRVNYSLGNSAYGRERFRFVQSQGTYFRFFFITLGLGLALLIGVSLLVGAGAAAAIGMPAAAGGASGPAAALGALATGTGIIAMLGAIIGGLGIAGYYQKSFNNAAFGGLQLGTGQFVSTMKSWPLIWIYVSNLIGIVLTLGLFYPWAKVRQLRYQFDNLRLNLTGSMDQFTAAAGQGTDAIGEEVGDLMDVDFGL